jgi:AraC family transcriptional regulator of adaptative response/methylated-DNA-[protein]-cysteine methyltransferase
MMKTSKGRLCAINITDTRWAAVTARDKSADGQFIYAVKSTGIYCRPSCPARLAKVENVCFYQTCEEAEKAGFRACKRCRPDQLSLKAQHTLTIIAACRVIESAEMAPTLKALANDAGMSVYHFHRVFKAIIGLTPKAYAHAHRAQRMRQQLIAKKSVTTAIFEAGYHSNSRFYEKSHEVLGMKPTNYRAGGRHMTLHFAVGSCSLGHIIVAQSERGICAIFLGDTPEKLVHELHTVFPQAHLIEGDKEFLQLLNQVIAYVDVPNQQWTLPLDIRGTAFQQRVWSALREIPWGETVSYTELARRLGAPKSVRSVARACATNLFAVVIPCHRVVRHNGELAGYRWGIKRKSILLQKEKPR